MVQIRVAGRPGDVDAATELLCRVTTVSKVSDSAIDANSGKTLRYVTTQVHDADCVHPVATIVRRGSLESIGGSGYCVEYGVCSVCGERVVRVAVQHGDAVSAVGGWSMLTEATPR